jgi:hypothetical protein
MHWYQTLPEAPISRDHQSITKATSLSYVYMARVVIYASMDTTIDLDVSLVLCYQPTTLETKTPLW